MLGVRAVPAEAATADTLSNALIQSIAVSPIYTRTGLVAVEGVQTGCQQSCTRIWISRDGGLSWKTAAAHGYASGMPLTIAVDAQGHEVLLAPNGSSQGFQTSTDSGDTWTTSGVTGRPTPAPSYAQSGTLAVAGGAHDVLVSPSGQQPIQGSSGSYADGNFVYMPGFPSSGGHSPALLGALDPHTASPYVLRCGADLSCTNAVALTGSNAFSGTPELVPSGDYASSGAVFAWTATGVFRSTDGGRSFLPLAIDQGASGSTNAYTGFGLAPGYMQGGAVRTAFAGVLQTPAPGQTATGTGGVFRTDDAGTTWRSISVGTPLVTGAQALAVAPDGRVYAAYAAGGNLGLLCTDDGQHWATTCSPRGPAAASSGGATTSGTGTVKRAAVSSSAGAQGVGGQVPGSTPDPGDTAAGAASSGTRPPGSAGTHVVPAGGAPAWLWPLGGLVLVVSLSGLVFRMRRHRRPA